jgi:methyltransferase (TIGR00027 family)
VNDRIGAAFLQAVDSPVPFPTAWPEPGQEVDDRAALHLHGSRYIGLRTRFYDDALANATEAGLRQVVLLAAGLDTRAQRLPWPEDVRVFEIDQPQVLAFKDDVLARVGIDERCPRTSVGADLREDWPRRLLEAGFDAAAPTCWVAEGLLAYLPADAEQSLLDRVTDLSSAGSRFVADRLLPADDDGRALQQLTSRSGLDMSRLVDTGTRQDAPNVLRRLGWSVAEEPVPSVAARYGRDLSDPFGNGPTDGEAGSTPPWLATAFLTAQLSSTSEQRD